MEIHPSASINPKAGLAPGVKIGPYCIIGEHVTIGEGSELKGHVVIEGHTSIGSGNTIYPFVSIGGPPQDVGYRGEDTRVKIGDNNIIRENVTINRATTKQDWVTIVGNDNFLMSCAHVGHDCVLGDNIIMSSAAVLGGHAVIGDHTTLGGIVAVHQFVRIGKYAFIGGMSGVPQDIPPFMIAAGSRVKLYGPNQTGLKRQGFSKESINGLKKAFMIIWRECRNMGDGIRRVREEMESFPELETLLDFIGNSKRGVTR